MVILAAVLFAAACFGLLVVAVQRVALEWALRQPIAVPRKRPGVSVLKPLCGLDDALEENLQAFAQLGYPTYEVLLGVKDAGDEAYPLAVRVAAQWPQVFRVVVQQGSPGLNPKVNQLATLEREARFDLLMVSDSNTRPPAGWLDEVVALFEDPRVACVSNAVTGVGHQSLGALLDNLHLASSVGAGQLGAKTAFDRDLVVGKAMALRRGALRKLGGFSAYADALAEDYVIGRDVVKKLGKRVAIARLPVANVAVRRSVGSFFRRYLRWGVVHRTAISLPMSLSQALLNPVPLAALAFVLAPSHQAWLAFAAVFLGKAALDLSAARRLGCTPLGAWALPAVALKDALLFITWGNGLFSRTVDWRGTRLRVEEGSRLVRPARAFVVPTREAA